MQPTQLSSQLSLLSRIYNIRIISLGHEASHLLHMHALRQCLLKAMGRRAAVAHKCPVEQYVYKHIVARKNELQTKYCSQYGVN